MSYRIPAPGSDNALPSSPDSDAWGQWGEPIGSFRDRAAADTHPDSGHLTSVPGAYPDARPSPGHRIAAGFPHGGNGRAPRARGRAAGCRRRAQRATTGPHRPTAPSRVRLAAARLDPRTRRHRHTTSPGRAGSTRRRQVPGSRSRRSRLRTERLHAWSSRGSGPCDEAACSLLVGGRRTSQILGFGCEGSPCVWPACGR